MINPRFVLRLSLLAVLLAACAPATSTAYPAQPTSIAPTATVLAPAATVDTSTQATAASTVLPIATSRGPNLEATDPTSVKLASGGLQLVEFFEFW